MINKSSLKACNLSVPVYSQREKAARSLLVRRFCELVREAQAVPRRLVVSRSITKEDLRGRGNHSDVYRGDLDGKMVAVKRYHLGWLSKPEASGFLCPHRGCH